MPHKYNAERRHRIPKARYKVTNWRDYEVGLRKRGSLTIWFTEEAIAAWRAAQRAGRMAGRKAWHQAPPGLAQAAPGHRCQDRHDRHFDPDQQGGRRCR